MQLSNGEFIPLAPLLTKLGVMLTLALVVERFMAIFNWIINRLFIVQASTDWEAIKQKQEQLELTNRAIKEAEILQAPITNPVQPQSDPREIESFPEGNGIQPDSRFDIKKITQPERLKVIKEFWLQILGAGVAVSGCFYMKFSIWVFITWAKNGGALSAIQSHPWEYIFTGIIIGAGSKPVNFLMNFIINRKIEISREEATKEAKKPVEQPPATTKEVIPTSPAIVTPPVSSRLGLNTIEDIVGFEYDGGDRPQRLENTHLFKKPIDMIVYHHTAMHSDSPFEEILREFDRKGWLTGYNCVVLKDGSIRVLCRWDRFGNHVKGFNNHSLGIALHGNFETNSKVPFSNYNGQYGILHPTSSQVDATARVVTLWTFMHKIDLRFPANNDTHFPKGIVPHKDLAPKACPGGNFPHQHFQERVKNYTNMWKNDKNFQQALNDFKAIPRVMA
ncbi:MAG: peptidoglycan recognition family protein [bacterium]